LPARTSRERSVSECIRCRISIRATARNGA
jgi:hypothetical protein